ncbi:hypothetical protein IPA_08005 [Ignicoccus pacificus DSM 13166]|uniref:Uncharacterized protein n=1 Tax=Ignicoccus pacificus DSM 13166 TaxID=940294 RepID=A0A977KBU1_9CREN|nr:hypothetical protein IPA_08005 [Ignicoccus pacificus DSM 13166]
MPFDASAFTFMGTVKDMSSFSQKCEKVSLRLIELKGESDVKRGWN